MFDIHEKDAIWNNWVIDDEIGRGTYGVVYRAHRVNAYMAKEQYAAVKHVPVDGPGDGDDIGMITPQVRDEYIASRRKEVAGELAAMVELHGKPHIMAYEDHMVKERPDSNGFDLFLRMELLTSLQAWTKKNGMPSLIEVANLGRQMAEAIGVLEKRHFVHRDIKPANIFVDKDGDFKLGDFGTARMLSAHNMASTRKGTPNYMAPEVFKGVTAYDQTVDIYSLGMVLYRLLNDNFLPFTDEDHPSTDDAMDIRMKGLRPMQPPRKGEPELNAIIMKCLEYQPAARWQNARDLEYALEDYLNAHQDDPRYNIKGGGA